MKNFLIFIVCSVFLFTSCKKQHIKMYYPDGTLEVEYNQIDGIKEGEYKSFYPSGKIEYKAIFKNGLRNGIEKKYYENGKLQMQGFCFNDKAQGWYYYYDKNQKLDSAIEYVMIDLKHPFSSYMNENIPDSIKVSISNRYFIYDKSGEIDNTKSLYFTENIKKDTISLGDTIWCAVKLLCLNKHKAKDYFISFYDSTIDRFYKMNPIDSISSYYFIPNKKGKGVITGTIDSKEDERNSYFFSIKYFVK